MPLPGDNNVAVGVAVIFVCTDELSLLITALRSLETAGPACDLEIVVIDNASADDIAAELARPWPQVKVIRRPRRCGLGDNLAIGVSATRAAYVLLCNCDVVFGQGSLVRLASFLDEHPAAGLAAPKLLSSEGEIWPGARRWYSFRTLLALKTPLLRGATRESAMAFNRYADWDYSSPKVVDWVLCPAAMARRAALTAVGSLDRRFRLYFGDVDLAYRLWVGGWEVWCVPEAEVVHLWRRASRRPFSAAWFSHLWSLVQFLVKHRRLAPPASAIRPVATGPGRASGA